MQNQKVEARLTKKRLHFQYEQNMTMINLPHLHKKEERKKKKRREKKKQYPTPCYPKVGSDSDHKKKIQTDNSLINTFFVIWINISQQGQNVYEKVNDVHSLVKGYVPVKIIIHMYKQYDNRHLIKFLLHAQLKNIIVLSVWIFFFFF